MAEANKHRSAECESCPTCKQKFIGRLQLALARSRMDHAHRSGTFDPAATCQLAAALSDHGKYEEAMSLYQATLAYAEKRFGYNHQLVADTQNKYNSHFVLL